TDAQRVFVIGNNGLWRSDDGGATWRQMDQDDLRVRNGQGGYNCGVYVDTRNPDVVYTINTSSYKSTDGGNTFTGFKGAPGGDDPQQLWLDPVNSNRMLLGLDQGATVTLDAGRTWSSWYNQSTEQVYHLAADHSAPYWIYATQQDAGAVRTRSRGNFGEITPLDWSAVPAWEWGTIVPDPLDPNTVFASGNGIEKVSYPSEQWISVSPAQDPELHLRTAFSQSIVFAPWNQHELLAGFQYLMATTDAGAHWRKISPDLSYPRGVTPSPDTAPRLPGSYPRGAIESMSASTVGRGTIWVGTNNGLIKVTRDDGKTWQDATIPNLPYAARALISSVDASHTDPGGAYVAVDVSRFGDYAPYLYRTHDYGQTWTRITNGLPTNEPSASFARVVRADPIRAGLLVAGTESGMYVSFDDGDTWQSLQLNLPNTSYRDLTFAGNDLVVGTYGRGIWVLDDYAVLRQLTPAVAREPVHLFRPDTAVRFRRNTNFDTPFPPEVPHALNPPDGAIIYYSLGAKPSGEVTLDVLDSTGSVLRHLSSIRGEPVKEAAQPPNPNFWLARPYALPAAAGLNRANWDLRLDAPPAFRHSFEINANPGLTPTTPEGIMAPPGTYTVKLTVDGRSYTQSFAVTADPRSPATPADLRAQYTLLRSVTDAARAAWDAYQQVEAMRAALTSRMPSDSSAEAARAIAAFRTRIDSVGGNGGSNNFGARRRPNFFDLNATFVGQLTAQNHADQRPTVAMVAAFVTACRDLATAEANWATVNATDLTTLNATLSRTGLKPVDPADGAAVRRCGRTAAR
ncbi:MAG: WD40/YVTN/BNR-like repeat-containing protein, partial [Gemmatimonadales bacterium]